MRPSWRWAAAVAFGAAAVAWAAATGSRGEQPESVSATGERLPYAGIVEDLLEGIGSGQIDEAIELFERHTLSVNDLARESCRAQFSALQARGGVCDGVEIVAVQPISGRLHRVFALLHFERSPIVFVATMRQFQGRWRIGDFQYSEHVAQFLGSVPVTHRPLSTVTDLRPPAAAR